MAIYGVGYRRLDYRQTSVWARLWPVAWNEYRSLFRRRSGVVLFFLCLGPSLFNLGVMLLTMGVVQVGAGQEGLDKMAQINPRMDCRSIYFFLNPIVAELASTTVFVVLTALVSCRAIAKDRETNALEIYWTRCIEPRTYFFAKWLGSFMLIGTAFVAAPLLIWLLASILAQDGSYFATTVQFMPRVMLALVVFTAVLTYIAVMFSAVAGRSNTASILWCFLIMVTFGIGRVLSRTFQGDWSFKAINPWDAMKRIAEMIAGVTPVQDYSPVYAIVSIGAIATVLTVGTLRRMRREEAIG